MIEAKAIYRVSCDDCLRIVRADTASIEFALAALKQVGWKIDYNGRQIETICPSCAERKKA